MSTISIAADILTIFIVVIFVWIGAVKGFLRSFARLLSVMLSAYLAKFLYPYTKTFLETITIKDIIKSFVMNKLNLTPGTSEISQYSVNALNLPDFVKKAFLESNYLKNIQKDVTATLAGSVSEFVADYCVTMLSYVLTFIIVGLAVYFVVVLLNIFSKLPVIKTFNFGLGGLMGFLTSCVVLWIVFTAMTIFLVNPNLSYIFDALDRTIVARLFYSYNPITSIVFSGAGGL